MRHTVPGIATLTLAWLLYLAALFLPVLTSQLTYEDPSAATALPGWSVFILAILRADQPYYCLLALSNLALLLSPVLALRVAATRTIPRWFACLAVVSAGWAWVAWFREPELLIGYYFWAVSLSAMAGWAIALRVMSSESEQRRA